MDLEKEKKLISDLRELSESVKKLASIMDRIESKQYLSVTTRPFKYLFYSFLHGIFIALGSTIGVVVILGILVYILKVLQFLPGIGGYFQELIPFLQK